MEPKLLIGLTGPARSGKDTVAAMLASRGFVQTNFAAPIRHCVSHITGLSVEQLTNSDVKEAPIPRFGFKSPRQMMQTLGTEWGRELIDRDIWLNATMLTVDANRDRPFVISDVRFDNEAEAIRSRGGVIWHIERPDAIKVQAHKSESGVTRHEADFVIRNISDLSYLELMVATALEDSIGVPE